MEVLFERTLLNSLLRDKKLFSKVFPILKSEYFTENRSEIFKLVKKHYQNYKQACSFADCAIQIKNLQNVDFKNAITEELQNVHQSEFSDNIEAMCVETLKFVKDALYLKALEIGSEGLMLKSDELKLKAEKILDERAKVSIDTNVGIEFNETEIIEYYSTETIGIKTQHVSINERLGSGFLPGTLSLILAASGVGKSLLMTDLISGFILNGKNVLLVSLEMAQEEVMKRVHSNVLKIPIQDFEPHRFNKDQFVRKLKEAKAKGIGLFYAKDFPAQSFGSLQLESLVETFKNEKNLIFDLVLVDYMGIMKSDLISPTAGLYSYVKSIAEELRASAKRLQLPIISASQLNRSATNNTGSDNSAVSDSYGSVMTADFLMFLLQTEEMKASGDIIAKITKNRFNGRTDTFPLKVDYEFMRFRDCAFPSIEANETFIQTFEEQKKAIEIQFQDIQKQDQELATIKDQELLQNKKSINFDSLNDILDNL